MVAVPDEPLQMSEAEYLEYERNSDTKHEYINGEVVAMSGASWEHNMICSLIIACLVNQFRGTDCQVSPSDLRVKVTKTSLYTYPDIVVICGDPVFVGNEFETITNPIVLIEVLSKTTAASDRGEKFQQYRQIETLQDYILIEQDKPHIECYSRQDDGTWKLREAIGLDASLNVPSIGCTLPLAEVYERVTFPEKTSNPDDNALKTREAV